MSIGRAAPAYEGDGVNGRGNVVTATHPGGEKFARRILGWAATSTRQKTGDGDVVEYAEPRNKQPCQHDPGRSNLWDHRDQHMRVSSPRPIKYALSDAHAASPAVSSKPIKVPNRAVVVQGNAVSSTRPPA